MRQSTGDVSRPLMMNCPGKGSRDGTAVHRANQDEDPSKGHPGSTEAGGGGGGATVRMGAPSGGVSLGHFRCWR